MKKKIFIDFETVYDTKAGYGLKDLSVLEYVRDPRFKVHGMGVCGEDSDPLWITGEVASCLAGLDWANTAVIAHNAKFDGFILTEKYGIRPGQWIDTLGMANAVVGKLSPGGSLAALAKYYGLPEKGVMKTDGLRDLTPEQEKELAEYCLHDVWLTREIFRRMEPQFPVSEYDQLDWTVRTFVEPKLVLNQKILEQAVVDEQKRKESLLARSQKDRAVFSSNQKFAKLLEEKGYEVPLKKSPRTQELIPAFALGDESFFDMLHSENQELRDLCETRVAVKSTLLETRAARLGKISQTGLWAFDVVYSGAKQTHRLSGGNSAGGNPQNFNRCQDKNAHTKGHQCNGRLRRAVEAPEGYKLIVGDFSMIECRLVAHLANDLAMLEDLKGDIYCAFGGTIVGRKITRADDREFRLGKEGILALGYQSGAKKLRVRVKLKTGIDLPEKGLGSSKEIVDLYRGRYIYVVDLWSRLQDSIEGLSVGDGKPICGLQTRKNEIILPSGLSLKYPNLRKVFTEKGHEWIYTMWGKSKAAPETAKLYGGKLLENISQALAGELCKEAAKKIGLPIVTGTIHDEIHALETDSAAPLVFGRLKEAMETSPTWMPQLKLKAEVGVGQNWLEAK